MKYLFKIFTFYIIFSLLSINVVNVQASDDYFKNSNNVVISKKDYERLMNLGFTENEILNLTEEEYALNAKLTGEILFISNQNEVSLCGYAPGYIESPYKILTTTIVKLSNGNYRYKVNLKWKKMPATRSYDIIALGVDDKNVNIVTGITAKQIYANSTGTLSTSPSYTSKTIDGGLAIFQLPSGTITSLESSLYFDISPKNSNLREYLNYGDYAHAQKSVSLTNAKLSKVNESGIFLNSSVMDSYDEMTVAKGEYNF